MNKKAFIWLIVVFAVLSGIFLITPSSYESAQAPQVGELFENLPSEKIAKIKLIQGAESIELELKDGKWTLPARASFPANFTKVRSIILKILTLNVSQRITTTAQNFASLGVDDDAVAKGKSRVDFLDSNGKELGALIIGEFRKKAEGALGPQGQGQYVRRAGSNDVYLISEAIMVSPKVTEWLESTIANVLQTQVVSVARANISNGGSVVEYELLKSSDSSTKAPKFITKEPLPGGFPLNEALSGQIVTGLENLRLEDVVRAGDASVEGLSFDQLAVYRLTNALEYQISTAIKDEKYYAKIKVEFSQSLADALKSEFEAQEKTRAVDNAESSSVSQSSSAGPVFSSAEKAAELSKQFTEWVYILPKYTAQKFRHTAAEIAQQPASNSSSSTVAAQKS